ncbi:MAG: hypothetical protein HY685_01110 [Chloroflexi bacterium]|nr:hypothetical protein [Chloroflexota bacterium]
MATQATQATQKITYQCAGCGTVQEVEVQAGQQAQAPICCGQPMKGLARK